MSKEDFGFEIEKHFFGSRHGKGPCDGEVGVLKRSASLAVRRGEVISNAEDFHKFAKETLSLPKSSATHTHAKRTFIKVNEGEIPRDQASLKDIKCIPQTRSTHQYRGIQPYIVTVRERSCFCEECVRGEGTCQNEHIVGRWNVHNLKIKRRAGKNVPADLAVVDNPDEPPPVDNPDEPPPPVDNPDEPPVDNPDEPPVDNPDEPPVDNPDEPPVDNPDEPPVDNPDEPPVDNPDEPPVDNPDEPPVDNPDEPPVDNPDEPPVDNPDEPPVDNPDEPPVDNPDEPPVDNPDEPPVDNPDEPPVDNPDEPPVDNPDEPPVDNPDEPPVDNPDEPPPVDNFDDLETSCLSIDPDQVMEEIGTSPSAFDISLNGIMSTLFNHEDEISIGQYVLATLSSDHSKNPKKYIAQIKDMASEDGVTEWCLEFMREARGLYFWPSDGDESWEPRESIIKTLHEPIFVKEKSTKSKQMFKFIE